MKSLTVFALQQLLNQCEGHEEVFIRLPGGEEVPIRTAWRYKHQTRVAIEAGVKDAQAVKHEES